MSFIKDNIIDVIMGLWTIYLSLSVAYMLQVYIPDYNRRVNQVLEGCKQDCFYRLVDRIKPLRTTSECLPYCVKFKLEGKGEYLEIKPNPCRLEKTDGCFSAPTKPFLGRGRGR